MTFKEWCKIEEGTLRNGQWETLEGMGYKVQVTQYSNKGPLFIILGPSGEQLGRAHFDLFTNQWKPQVD